jgi:hypothetical protein
MKTTNWIKIGTIFFFVGCIFILISWLFTYPVYMSDINQITFFQFYPLLWPGITICLLGIFINAYYCQSKIINALYCALVPLVLEVPVFFYSYLPSSDCGNVRGMFQIFEKTGINLKAISYFEFPSYFSLNQIIHETVGLDEKGIAVLSFALYGILLSLFLYLVFFNLKKSSSYRIIPSLLVMLYFIGMYSLLNYQWVPQTLALVYFFLLLLISSHLLSDLTQYKWQIMLILIFTALVFTHAFIPVLFIVFFGVLIYKKISLLPTFLVIISIFLIFTFYYALFHTSLYIGTFQQSIQGFGGEYAQSVSNSFVKIGEISFLDRILSVMNGIRLPLVWGIVTLGALVLFFKRKMNIFLIALGVAGGVYIATGALFDVLGLRAAQILFIPLLIGLMFFISKWRKPTVTFVVVILVLAVFGPMRSAYDQTAFQTDEEAKACDFLANNIKNVTNPKVAINQVDWGYFTSKYAFLTKVDATNLAIRPGSKGFLDVFNSSLHQNHYILYNSNLGKTILMLLMTKENLTDRLDGILYNNKIYTSGTTFIINGIKR